MKNNQHVQQDRSVVPNNLIQSGELFSAIEVSYQGK